MQLMCTAYEHRLHHMSISLSEMGVLISSVMALTLNTQRTMGMTPDLWR